MLHTKVHGNRSTGSKDDFKGFLQNMGMEAVWSSDQHYINIFSFPYSLKLTYKILSKKVK